MKILNVNKSADNYPQQKKIKVVILFTLVMFIIGEVSIFSIYPTNSENLSKISSFVIKEPVGDAENSGNWFLIFASTSLTVLTTVNLLFLLHLRKIYSSLVEENREVLLEIDKEKNEEVKEITMTRNVLLMKLMGKKNN